MGEWTWGHRPGPVLCLRVEGQESSREDEGIGPVTVCHVSETVVVPALDARDYKQGSIFTQVV